MSTHQHLDDLGMMRIESRIQIYAPPELVWSVTIGIDGWPTWSPTVRAVHGLDGNPLTNGTRFRLSQPLQRARLWQVTRLEPPVRAEWETVDAGPPFRAIHEATPEADGTLSFLGLVAKRPRGILSPAAALALRTALAVENRALRRRCLRVSGNRRLAS
ncbi:SRPBCC family protein [Rhodophyticola porphyridii]|uniref:SRPBCC family protein n=1 Tax=Rhodophyticola porphyridii TaxID=1852017 RepID=A0A3L9XVZ2_9RHOB|nr:SRPBCC family protein [Rhodophyticola porphyridii]RMA40689.1 hypothetical protein D9R08_18230 [Rhodophyticola porphyridii]